MLTHPLGFLPVSSVLGSELWGEHELASFSGLAEGGIDGEAFAIGRDAQMEIFVDQEQVTPLSPGWRRSVPL
jgi:hypothetical protein